MNKINLPFFEFSGFAAKTDLKKEDWKIIYQKLEVKQQEFIKYESQIRSRIYKWPRDPLHTWSRLWEYPYVFHHIRKAQKEKAERKLNVIDFGSGVTFFPFAIAELGCNLICVDIDPICIVDIPKAKENITYSPGSINVKLITEGRIPVEPKSQDIVYCISVIEHIQNFESVIDQMARVLKDDGILILTVDIDLRERFELNAEQYERLMIKLNQYFVKAHPERPIHPCDLLTTSNSPYPLKNGSFLSSVKQIIKNLLSGNLLNGDPRVGIMLAIYSGVYVKKLT